MSNNIYFIINSLGGGGAERVCTTIANELNKDNLNISIVILNKCTKNDYSNHLDSRINVIDLSSTSTLKSYFKLLNYMKIEKPKNVFAFSESIASICAFSKIIFKLNTKIVARNINHLSTLEKNNKDWRVKILLYFSRLFYRRVDKIISQSIEMSNDLINNWNIDSKKVVVINNPVSDNISKYSSQIQNIRNKNFIFVGRLEEQKGLFYLLDAVKICKENGYNITLEIFGDGSLYNQLEEFIIKNNLINNAKLRGSHKDIGKIYLKSHAVVLSSLFEGLPNVLIESITLGTPVISFDCPSGPSEIIENGENGFLVEYLNSNDLADKMIKSLDYKWNQKLIQNTAVKYKKENILQTYKRELNSVFKIAEAEHMNI